MKSLSRFILAFIIGIVTISIYLIVRNKESGVKIKPIDQSFCGTKSDTQNNPDAQKGKQIFNANCAACHKLDAFATAPALRDIAGKYRAQNLRLYGYLQGKRKKRLLKNINKMTLCPVFPDLTKQDVTSLEAYTR